MTRFCDSPFKHLEVTLDGDAYLCCPGWLPKSIGSLKEKSFEEVWNGPEARAIRASILDGSFRFCEYQRCGALQKGQKPVVERRKIKDPVLLNIIENQLTEMTSGPQQAFLSYDPTCNLSCPTCRTSVIAISGPQLETAEEMLAKIKPQLRFLKNLKVTGSGDPFASPHFSKFLDSLDAREYPQLKIYVHTNGLLLTPARWLRLEKIHDSIDHLEISVDAATAETYQINRRGGRFETLRKNLEFLREVRREGRIERLKLSFVVQANNWREMSSFVDFGREFEATEVVFARLVNWGTFDASEFARRAIHEPTHPEHGLFREELKKSVFGDEFVYLSNLHELRQEAPRPPSADPVL